jgi:hypothetical protein
MTIRRKRPLGVTLLAIVFLWIGCFGSLFFPIMMVADKGHMVEMVAAGHAHEGLLRFAGYTGLLIWWLGYILYAFIGFGLWKLKDWARRCVLWITVIALAIGLIVTAIAVRDEPMMILPMLIGFGGFYALQIWYLRLRRIRLAFGAEPTLDELTPTPGPPPKQSLGWKILWIASGAFVILCVFVGSLLYGIESMFRRSEIYQMGLREAGHSDCVARKVGLPLTPGRMSSGELSESTTGGDATLSIPVRGPKGEGSIVVLGTKDGGSWTITSLALVRGDVEDKILPEAAATCEAAVSP